MPPAKRLRTEPIVRVRTGCWTCRRRKKKCDEAKPTCGGCVRNKLSCSWPSNLSGASTGSRDPPDAQSQTVAQHPELPKTDRRGSASPSDSGASSSSSSHSAPPSPADVSLNIDPTGPLLSLTDADATSLIPMGFSHAEITPNVQIPNNAMAIGDVMPRSLSMLPGYSPESFQLLSHYLATTADCMANGSTPVNPFLVQIVPLAFTSDLLLQLVLTQSAAHRAFRTQNDVDGIADSHYTKALRLFRKGVTEFIDGKETNPLMLTVGALVMCFTETAKGDMNGTIFDHLSAANSLLLRLLSQSDTAVPKDLKDFVIEYYTYTATVSMISIDARASPQLLLNFDLEQRARQLLASEYVGNLSGCWLELLLLIPCIFDLGRQWMVHDTEENETEPNHNNNHEQDRGEQQQQPIIPTADDIAMYGSLQAQIIHWTPYSFVTPEVFLAGRIFQQAMLLYLYTSLGSFSRTSNGMHQALIDSAITEAMLHLSRLSAMARINSGLCWPIAVVGACLSNAEQQDELRRRLTTMVHTFGLGNMQRTLLLLEYMWQLPLEKAGPWNICRVMRQQQIWISFA